MKDFTPMLEEPNPDFDTLTQVLAGKREPQRVHLVELSIDDEILQLISEESLDTPLNFEGKSGKARSEEYYRQLAHIYFHLGYDSVPVELTWKNHPKLPGLEAEDTSSLSRGNREWVNESGGLISSWGDFEAFPWECIEVDISPCKYIGRHMPHGMKITPTLTCFEHVQHYLLGQEPLYYMLYDKPDLVSAVFQRWGEKVYQGYRRIIKMEDVGAIFHADDLGHKTATFISPRMIDRHILPWLEEFAKLAHEHEKMFWYHCCGNVYGSVIQDLIERVKIDAFHSFQDNILSIAEFKYIYGEQVAALGGVDLDKLIRLPQESLWTYSHEIIQECLPGGRFAFGSGNTIANYVPIENYFIMLAVARSWYR